MKRVSIFLLVMLLIVCQLVPVTAFADEEQKISIINVEQQTEEEGLNLLIELENTYENAGVVDSYHVKLDKEELSVLTIDPEETTDENTESASAEPPSITVEGMSKGKSWIILVDNSTLGSDSHLTKLVQSLLYAMDENDNAVVVSTSQSSVDGLVSPTLKSLINSIENTTVKVSSSDETAKRLYSAIVNALETAENCKGIKGEKRLVILSKGRETKNWQDGASAVEAQKKIIESGTVVYTIGYTEGYDLSPDFTTLASLPDTVTGRSIAVKNFSDENIDIIINEIRNREEQIPEAKQEHEEEVKQSSTKHTLVVAQPDKRGKKNQLTVTFEGIEAVSAVNLSTSFRYAEDKNIALKLWNGLLRGELTSILILAVAVLVILLLVLVIIACGKKKAKQEDVPPPMSETGPADLGGATIVSEYDAPSLRPQKLKFTFRESSGMVYDAVMTPAGITAGRSGDNTIVLPATDKKISRNHFIIKQNSGKMILTNISQTNGVTVNNMRINGPIELRQQDTIRVGDVNMIVTWKYE